MARKDKITKKYAEELWKKQKTMTEEKKAQIAVLVNVVSVLNNAISLTYPELLEQSIDMDPDESWKPNNQASMVVEMQKSVFSEKERDELRHMILTTTRLIFNELSELRGDITDDVI